VIPMATFPRVFLPICWLVGLTPRIFSTQRKDIIPSSSKDLVMIAKVEGEKSMVVIEQVGDCIYSMCTLKKDLKVKDVRTVAKTAKECGSTNYVRTAEETMHVDGEEWWRRMMVRNLYSTNNQQSSLQFLVKDDSAEFVNCQ